MGFDFSKKKAAKKTEDLHEGSDYRERAKQERARRERATDGYFWFAVCFKERPELDQFRAMFGMGDSPLVSGVDFREMTREIKPEVRKSGFAAKTIGARAEDPLKDVDYNGNLEHDCAVEAMALFGALKSAKKPSPCKHATDSDEWFCVYFETQEDKNEYLADWSLLKYGSNYLDGSAWLAGIKRG